MTNKKSIIETAKRLLYLRRCEPKDSKNYETQLKAMSKEYGLTIDLENDKVSFKENS